MKTCNKRENENVFTPKEIYRESKRCNEYSKYAKNTKESDTITIMKKSIHRRDYFYRNILFMPEEKFSFIILIKIIPMTIKRRKKK